MVLMMKMILTLMMTNNEDDVDDDDDDEEENADDDDDDDDEDDDADDDDDDDNDDAYPFAFSHLLQMASPEGSVWQNHQFMLCQDWIPASQSMHRWGRIVPPVER